jgi:Flp pilus assembly protein TadG
MHLDHVQQPRRCGAVTVEFAVVFFLLVLFMFVIFEYGRLLMMRHLVNNAAREGARQAAINCNFTQDSTGQFQALNLTPQQKTTQVQNTVFNLLASQPLNNSSGQPLQASDVQVSLVNPGPGQQYLTDATFGEGVMITVNTQYQPMLPGLTLLFPTPIALKCIMGSEANN